MAASQDNFIAVTRFGLGAKLGDFTAVAGDPRGWLVNQLKPEYAQNQALNSLPSTMEAVQHLREDQQMKQQAKKDAAAAMDEGSKAMFAGKIKEAQQELNQDYIKQVAALTRATVESTAPFFERLVQFWRNHFTVSITKQQDRILVTSFERDAIRPNVLGNFHDMLRASTRHPAMQIYLDNFHSIGPDSPAGQRQNKGLNENLAREIMELHTLGVNGGYTQKDVTEFAKILTGWTIDAQGRGDGSGFFFAPRQHEPGSKTLLGVAYNEDGVNEGEEALTAFSRSPSTAKFIATKLARHFIADDPPENAVTTLQAAFTQNNGDLIPVYRTLIALDEAWQSPLAKVKTPNDLILSLLRATNIADSIEDKKLVGAFRMLNQMPFSAPSPAGWSDKASDWIGAEALLQRIDLARLISRAVHTQLEPAEVLENTIGPVASKDTRSAVTRAGSTQEALALLFSSPEFQRR
jgi:uncharacterized protein (DUF1800 family)